MIVRILGEGQLDVADNEMASLNDLDQQLLDAVESGDEAAFRGALDQLLERVRQVGRPVPDETLAESDLVLPPSDADIDEVRALIGDEGLIPG